MPRKRHWSSSQEPINHYSKYRCPWIHFDVDSFKPCNIFVVQQERSILLSKILLIKFFTLEPLFSVVTASSVKTSNGVFFRGRTSHKGVLSEWDSGMMKWLMTRGLHCTSLYISILQHNECRLYYEPLILSIGVIIRWMGCNRTEGKPELLFLGNEELFGTIPLFLFLIPQLGQVCLWAIIWCKIVWCLQW